MRHSSRAHAVLGALFALLFSSQALPAYVYNMRVGVTEISREIHQLHMAMFWVCVGIGIIVFSVMFYAIIWHRKSRGVTAAHFHEHPMVEVAWTLVPCLILIILAIPATKLLIKMSDTENDSDLSIKITGHQWRWEYEYLGKGVRFISNNTTPQDQINNRAVKNEHYLLMVDKPIVVPVGKKIRFLTTASDVIHSWWLPDLGIKKDAIPGFINEAWARIEVPGTYRGQCAELCGVNHGFMPIVLEAKPLEEYEAWLNQQQAANLPADTSSTPSETQPSTTTTPTTTAQPSATQPAAAIQTTPETTQTNPQATTPNEPEAKAQATDSKSETNQPVTPAAPSTPTPTPNAPKERSGS